MKTDLYLIILLCAGTSLITYLITTLRLHKKINQLRKNSVRQSRNTILGEVTEKLTPLLPEFPYHTKDIVFLGKGVDYVVFDGLAQWKLKDIIFLEIKSGNSQLNRNETMIKEYLRHTPVKYELLRVKY